MYLSVYRKSLPFWKAFLLDFFTELHSFASFSRFYSLQKSINQFFPFMFIYKNETIRLNFETIWLNAIVNFTGLLSKQIKIPQVKSNEQ